MNHFFSAKKGFSQFLIGILLGILVFPTASFAAVKLPGDKIPAVPTSDAALRTKVVGLTIAGQTVQGLTLDSLATAFVRGILTELTNQTVKWINSGFQGGPQYAVDLKNYLQNEADATAGYVIGKEVPGLCSPFQNVVKLALIDAQAANTQSSAVQSSCTLSQVSSNIDNFMNGDFVGSGGYPAWFEMTQDPYGNPYSSFLNVQASVDVNTEAALANQTQQLAWNQGFLSTEKCTEQASDGSCNNYSVETPGSVIATQFDKLIGSQTDQLNLSTDFNDIALALVGELQNIVFNSAKGIFDKNPYSNSYSGGSGGGGANTGTCSPSNDTYVIGQPAITWSFGGVTNDTTTYSWTGDDIDGTTTPSPTIDYTTEGSKTAGVTVMTSLDGGLSTSTITQSCSDNVVVSKYPPLGLSCQLLDADGKTANLRVQPGTTLYWVAEISGGSGTLNQIDIDETKTYNVDDTNDFGAPTGACLPGLGCTGSDKSQIKDPTIPQHWNNFSNAGEAYAGAFPSVQGDGGLLESFFTEALSTGPVFWYAGNPHLPLTPDPTTHNINVTFPIDYTQNGDWTLAFNSIRDADPNVPVFSGASCPQSVNVDPHN